MQDSLYGFAEIIKPLPDYVWFLIFGVMILLFSILIIREIK